MELVQIAVDVADDVQRSEPLVRDGPGSGTAVTSRVSPRLITGRSRAVGVYPSGGSPPGTALPGWGGDGGTGFCA